jgi:GNAT superfamily N-acetyltransferase
MDGMTAKRIDAPDARIPLGMRPGRRELGPASLEVALSAAVPIHMREGTREIAKLIVPVTHRRKHLATALMNLVCQEADANGKTLLLIAEPFGEDGPNSDELVAWYEKFGFRALQDVPSGTFMARRVHQPESRLARGVRLALVH